MSECMTPLVSRRRRFETNSRSDRREEMAFVALAWGVAGCVSCLFTGQDYLWVGGACALIGAVLGYRLGPWAGHRVWLVGLVWLLYWVT